jgi:predicted AAA+ superfamily ATPase
MQEISTDDIIKRIRVENPWWEGTHNIAQGYRELRPRAYFALFLPLVRNLSVRRAVVLMGPRRVGKTVMIHQAIQRLIDEGIPPKAICYFSVDHPIFNGLSLDKLLECYGLATGMDYRSSQVYAFFDEIQYMREWEQYLKSLVDTYPNVKTLASGSAAAALRLKSEESGAGRFTDFLLPPLTFYEYLDLLGKTELFKSSPDDRGFIAIDIVEVNRQFIDYLNVGGYPEVVFSREIQSDPGRYIKNDIIDKVLLRDLPSLYGISDIQELNSLFTTLAFNTANEVSLEELSKNSGVAKNTIKRYIEYLEAAFLIKLVHRVDRNAKKFRRANFFKVYLANPSMRAALFAPIDANDERIGALVETAIFSQWFHGPPAALHYARWSGGEVDIVSLASDTQKPSWAVEVKWSDRYCDNPGELKSVITFCRSTKLLDVLVTSKTKVSRSQKEGVTIEFVPASSYCFTVGFNAIHNQSLSVHAREKSG